MGKVRTDEGEVPYGAQIIALGDGKFQAVGYRGGLPGAGWDKSEKPRAEGRTTDGVTTFVLPEDDVTVTVKDGAAAVKTADGQVIGSFKKTTRTSPTMGAKPPAGAIVLFDGSTADTFKGGPHEQLRAADGRCYQQANLWRLQGCTWSSGCPSCRWPGVRRAATAGCT